MGVCQERGLTIRQATEIIRQQERSGGQQPAEDALESLLTLRERQGRSPRTLANLKNQCRAFFRHCGRDCLGRIDRADCEDWIFSGGRPDSQLSRYAALSNLLNHAVKMGWLPVSPLAGLERPRRARAAGAAVFMPEDAESFLRALEGFRGGVLVSFYAILILGGLRPSEALALGPGDVRAQTIRVTGGKRSGRSRRNVPISPALRAWLDAYSHYPLMPEGLKEGSGILRQARGLAPVPWVLDICRHTYASYRLALTNDENAVSREMGTRPETIYNNYFEVMELADAERFDRIRPGAQLSSICLC